MSLTKTLSEVERRVLGHISRFRLTTATIWPRVQDLRDIPPGDIGDAIGRLLMEKYLIRGLIVKSVRYFALAEKGASFLNAKEASKSQLQYGLLSERAKIKACGVLDFCAAPNVGWLPATDEEMRSLYGADNFRFQSCWAAASDGDCPRSGNGSKWVVHRSQTRNSTLQQVTL